MTRVFGLRYQFKPAVVLFICQDYLLREVRQRVNDLMAFYEGLKGFVTDLSALNMVDRIIAEEVQHFEYIERLLLMASDLSKDVPQRVR
jgi:hypothetical protein